MNSFKFILGLSVILSVYIIGGWIYNQTYRRSTLHGHTLGCYSAIENVQSPFRLSEKMNELNARQIAFVAPRVNQEDKLVGEISQKLYLLENSYLILKHKHQNYFDLQSKLRLAIQEANVCKAKVSHYSKINCSDALIDKNDLVNQLESLKKDLAVQNKEKNELQAEFINELNHPAGSNFSFTNRQLQIKKEIEKLNNAKEYLEEQRILKSNEIKQVKPKLNKTIQDLKECEDSNRTATICHSINRTLQAIYNRSSNINETKRRVDNKEKQIQFLINAKQACTSNKDEQIRLDAMIEKTRRQYKELHAMYIDLVSKENQCSELCDQQRKNFLKHQKQNFERLIENLKADIHAITKSIEQHEARLRQLRNEWETQIQRNQEPCQGKQCDPFAVNNLHTILVKMTTGFERIKTSNANIKVGLSKISSVQDRLAQHVRNSELLNECSVKYKIAQNIQSQIEELEKKNKITISAHETEQILKQIALLTSKLKFST